MRGPSLRGFAVMLVSVRTQAPPFSMLGSSGRFVFNETNRIQFVAGMYRLRDRLVVSYGVGDDYSMETSVPVSAALKLLNHVSPRHDVRTHTERP